jgi:hypothetical protein
VVEYRAVDRPLAIARLIWDDADGSRLKKEYVSDDGVHWSERHSSEQISLREPYNGQTFSPKASAPRDDKFQIAQSSRLGLRRTFDGGAHWESVGEERALSSVAELRGQKEALESLKQRGLAPIGDIGALTWRKLIVEQIVFDTRTPRRVFLLTNKGIYRSDDYANHWSLLQVGLDMVFEVQSLAIDPADGDRLLVGTTQAVYFSADGGCRFSKVLSR